MPWWWWPLALGTGALLAAEVFLGAPTPYAWTPYALLIVAVVGGFTAASRIRIRVRDGVLHVDDAHIPVSCLSEINIVDAETKRELLGPLADPLAFVVQRPWVARAVRVVLDDPDDPTPYWVISTRRPERLAAAIAQARARSDRPAATLR